MMNIQVLDDLEKTVSKWFKDTPALPEGFRTWLANYAWLLTLISAVLLTLTGLGLLSVIGVWSSVTFGYGASLAYNTFWLWLALIALAVTVYLQYKAVNPLKAMKKEGWKLLFYVEVFYVGYALVSSFAYTRGLFSELAGLVIGAAIGLYLLYQIKPHFK